jgi:DNA-binding transcriptional LysR family regulator
MNVQDIDLNLLIGFDALLDELSVSRAAARLGVTQPAMSSTLKRLRQLFDDPLLVRSSDGMLPTDKAKALKGRVKAALASIQALMDDAGEFDPKTLQRTLHIGLNDYASVLVIPRVYPLIRSQAPGLKLVFQPRKNIPSSRLDLETGLIDFAIGIGSAQELPGSLIVRKLFDDPFLTMVRRDHPSVGDQLTLDQFVELEHLVVSPQGHDRGVVDDVLARLGRTRKVGVIVPHFSSAAPLVAESDLVCTIPGRIARLYTDFYPIRCVPPPPLDLPLGNVSLAWHAVSHDNPVHRWVREQFAAAFPKPS